MAGQPLEPPALVALFRFDHARDCRARRDWFVPPQPRAGDRRSGAELDRRRSRGGIIEKVPGEASAAGSFAPRVYIPLQDLEQTNLLKPGSIARYRDYVKFSDGTDVEKRIETLAPQIQRLGLEYDTVAKRKRDLGTALENLYRFLNLVGFMSLLLGS